MMMKSVPKVNATAVGSSLTEWGGKNMGGKARTNNRYKDLMVDRNMNKSNQGAGT